MKRIQISFLLTLLVMIFTSCETPQPQAQEDENNKLLFDTLEMGPYRCDLDELGISPALGSPSTIAQAVELMNALPRPLNIPCFISALNRPLKVNLTNSGRSAQPASGNESPRIFIMNDPLVMSITVEGGGSAFIEFAEFTSSQMSIKAELKFPIAKPIIDLEAPFKSIDAQGKTKCVGCHIQEAKVTNSQYPGDVYESLAFKPTTNQKVEVTNFKLESYKCDMLSEPSYRCRMIYAIYNHGDVEHENFPDDTLTFLESFGL